MLTRVYIIKKTLRDDGMDEDGYEDVLTNEEVEYAVDCGVFDSYEHAQKVLKLIWEEQIKYCKRVYPDYEVRTFSDESVSKVMVGRLIWEYTVEELPVWY